MSEFPPEIPQTPTEPSYAQYPRPGYNIPVSADFGPPEFDIAVIGMAWKLVQRNLANWIIAELIVGVLGAAMSMPVSFALQASSLAPPPGAFPTLQQFALQELVMLPVVIVQYSLQMGLFRLALNQLRGLPTSPGDVFDFKGQYFQVLLGVLIFQLAFTFGLILLVLPGLLIATLLMFTNILVIDKKMTAVAAAQLSWNTVKPHMWTALGVAIVASLASFLGIFACCIGVFATAPILWMTVAIHYMRFFCPQGQVMEGSVPSYSV